MKALFILVRFSDENRASWNNGWPINPSATRRDVNPSWADSLLEDVSAPSFPSVDGSITHLMHIMSQGQLRFRGEVFDSVIVLPSMSQFPSVAAACRAAIDSVSNTGIDFASFVNLHPGGGAGADTLDYVAVVFRGLRTFWACGDSCAQAKKTLSTTADGGTDWFTHSVRGGSIFVDSYLSQWATGVGVRVPETSYPTGQSGTLQPDSCDCSSSNGFPVMTHSLASYRPTIVHEIGHSLYRNVASLDGGAHIWSLGNWDIMFSNGRGGIMCAAARYSLGWLDPIEVEKGTNATIRLYDSSVEGAPAFTSARSDSVCCVIWADSTHTQFYVLENRRMSSPYTEAWDGATFQSIMQPGSGLLITHVNLAAPNNANQNLDKRFNVEAAAGLWDESFEPDPVDGRHRISSHYVGQNVSDASDVFRPGTSTTFAPYTCPNTSLYGSGGDAARQIVLTGLAVLNIADTADSSYTMNIRWGQSADSTSENTTWDGLVMLTDDFKIAADDTVTATGNATILLRGAGALSPEGRDPKRIEILSNGRLKLEEGLGTGPRFGSSRDTDLRKGPYASPDSLPAGVTAGTADWYGIRVPSMTKLYIQAATIQNARSALAMETGEIPRISLTDGIVFLNNYTKMGFDRDVVVDEDSTLTVPENFTIGFTPNSDQANQGIDAARCELIVEGAIELNGANYYNQVLFMSNDPDSADSYKRGDWYGMRVLPYPPSEGNCDDGARELHFTKFRDAVHGIAVTDTCLMTLNWPLFENNQESDILLDRDVRIPWGRQIDLRAPTKVVVTAGSTQYDHLEGESGKVDLIVSGALITRRPGVVQPTDWVIFESTARDSVNADDWGGITVTDGATGVIEDADIGFAMHPVYFASADSADLFDSRIHHYSEYGVLDWGSESHVQGCVFERGSGLDAAVHATALRLVRSGATVEGNQITWQNDYGIWFGTEQSYCTANISPPPPKVVTIRGNRITGSDGSQGVAGSAGIYGEWLCHEYQTAVEADTVEAWSGRAIHLHQAADVDLSCNRLDDNWTAVRYFRDTSKLNASEGPVQFKQNTFKRSYHRNFRVSYPTKLLLYDRAGSGAAAGKNSFQRRGQLFKNVWLDFNDPLTVDAGQSAWLDSTGTAMSDSATIQATNILVDGDVLLSPILSGEDLCSSSALAIHGETRSEAVDRPGAALATTDAVVLPNSWSLLVATPNPSASWPAEIAFDVPQGHMNRVRVSVYTVNGRRVAVLHDGTLPPGRYRRTWSGTDQGGRAVSSGVYFLRLEAGDQQMTKKLVVLF